MLISKQGHLFHEALLQAYLQSFRLRFPFLVFPGEFQLIQAFLVLFKAEIQSVLGFSFFFVFDG